MVLSHNFAIKGDSFRAHCLHNYSAIKGDLCRTHCLHSSVLLHMISAIQLCFLVLLSSSFVLDILVSNLNLLANHQLEKRKTTGRDSV